MKKYFNRIKAAICALAILTVWVGCTKYENPPAVYEDLEQGGDGTVKRKVLFISIDGAVGEEIRKIMPSNLKDILKKSKYSFNALGDGHTSDASTWMSMMSGVPYSMHQIADDSYIPKPNPNNPHANGTGYPSLLYRIATIAPSLKSYVVARDEAIANKLLISADESFVSKTDEEVKKNIIELLDKKNPSVAIVQFKDVLTAGITAGFSSDKTPYVDAIKKVDGYIGEIMTALKNRKNFENEDWLVIITSNHGGEGNSYGGDSNRERNVFAVYYNENFKSKELNASRMITLRYKGWFANQNITTGGVTINSGEEGTRAVSPTGDAAKMYDIGNNPNGFSVEFKINFQKTTSHPGATYSNSFSLWYQPILGKRERNDNPTPGWLLRTHGDGQIAVRLGDGTNNGEVLIGNRKNDEWFHFTVTIKKVDSKTTRIDGYVNGVLANSGDIQVNYDKVISNSPFFVGYLAPMLYGLADFKLTDLRVWNKALTSSEVSTVVCMPEMNSNEPLNTNVLGYYRGVEQSNTLKTALGIGPELSISGDHNEYSLVQNISPCTAGDDSVVLIQSNDIYTQIFYWLEIQTQRTWNLQGQVFLNKYEVEFLKP